jgi:predicted ribosomally synthesized peptide with nif11-like leader
MSDQQLAAFLAKIKDDANLREKIKGALDDDGVLALAKMAGFDVSKAEMLRYQASKTLELSDAELENLSCSGWKSAILSYFGCD